MLENRSMLGIWSDLVFAARVLRRSRGFTIIAVSSLALAIGANTTIFSVGKQLLFDRLDVPHASSLRLLATTDFSYPVYEHLRAQNTVLGDLLAFHATAANATVGDNAERVLLHEVSGNYYEVLGVRAQIGREIRPSDDMPGSPAVAMISDAFWNREFARSPAAIGRSIKINDVPVTIIGVNPKGFTGAGSTLPSADAGGHCHAGEGDARDARLQRPELARGSGGRRPHRPRPRETGCERSHGADDARRAVRHDFPRGRADSRQRYRADTGIARRQPRPVRAATGVRHAHRRVDDVPWTGPAARVREHRHADAGARRAAAAGDERAARARRRARTHPPSDARRKPPPRDDRRPLGTRARLCRTRRHRAIHAALRLAGVRVYRGDHDRHRPALRVRAGVRGLAHGDRRQRQATPRRWTIGGRIPDRAGDASGYRRRALHSIARRPDIRQSGIPHGSSAARADRPAAESLPRRRERRVPSANGTGDRRDSRRRLRRGRRGSVSLGRTTRDDVPAAGRSA